MNEIQSHRGPDDWGAHLEPGIGLGHRRLSIIDVSAGRQPIYNEDRSVVVVYNGEIYNFGDLRKELVRLGHKFRTSSDTEVIVHAWEQWGDNCVKRFRGMFAFALWDSNRKALFLARDRLGIKPLYYAVLPDGYVIFSSELKALLIHPGFVREVNPLAVEDYFAYGYIPDPKTIFASALKLSPAHTLTVVRGTDVPEAHRYWDVSFEETNSVSERQATVELIERLREAVRIRLISEVPLGAFLSGGVDSSAVVAMMSELSEEPTTTCSIEFGDSEYNEAEYAGLVAARYGTTHYADRVDAEDFDLIDDLANVYDEPFADSSAIPTYRVCQLARKHVTVALSGDGGDEILAGYRRYRWHLYEEQVRSLLPPALRRCLLGSLGGIYPKADWAPKVFRAKSTLQSMAKSAIDGYFHSVSLMGDEERKRLFRPEFQSALQGYQAAEVLRDHARDAPVEGALSLVQYLDIKTWLAGDILTKVDRASMAHSLEVRVPLLDHELVEWLARLPPEFKLRKGEGKYIFKKALEPYLPKDILYRPKMGFSVPLAKWFRGPLRGRVRDAALGSILADTGFFNERAVDRLVSQHEAGMRDHSVSLWALIMFEAFYRQLMDIPPFIAEPSAAHA